jgi:hypothetical protein
VLAAQKDCGNWLSTPVFVVMIVIPGAVDYVFWITGPAPAGMTHWNRIIN